MRRLLYIVIGCLLTSEAPGQRPRGEMPSMLLDTVVVTARRAGGDDVNVGARVSRIGEAVLAGNQTKSLSELLSDNSTVYIKSLGQGAYSTSSFRGTTPSQTQVNWNGININPILSTSFDFSKVPVFFTDDVTLYHGGTYFKNGTGAIGGSINLANAPSWLDSTMLRAFVEYGSYQTMTGAASVRFLSERALYQTRVYFQQSDNDYRYLNKWLSKDPFYENRKEAAYQQSGVMQEAYFKTKGGGLVSNNLWLMYGNRRLPQPIIVNVTSHEKQQDTGLKYFLGYDFSRGRQDFSVKGAYQLDVLDYEKWSDNGYSNTGSMNWAHSLTFKGEYRYRRSPRWEFGGSLSYTHDFARVRTDTTSSVGSGAKGKYDFRVDRDVLALQANALWHPTGKLTLNAQVMGEVNDGRFAPTFSFGGALPLVGRVLSAKANVSYNYRFPSLNDLYWYPVGNPDLKPEKGYSCDATLSYTPRVGPLYIRVEASYYVMHVDDLIMWLMAYGDEDSGRGAGYLLRPVNKHNVLSHGLEWTTELTLVLDRFRARLAVNYSYSPSYSRRSEFEGDWTFRSQLPYVPIHKANGRLGIEYRNAYLTYQVYYSGIRYTNDDQTYFTNAYTVHDLEVGYHWKVGRRCRLTPKIRVSTLFNAYYESTEYYPMPLRNVLGSIVFSF